MSAEEQTELLANYIMANVPGEPSRDEGAGRCAVRLLAEYRGAFQRIMNELGVPGPGYPAPVANAWEIAAKAILGPEALDVLGALEAVADAARGVVEGTDADRPTSLSTMSLMALADALDELDKEAADGR